MRTRGSAARVTSLARSSAIEYCNTCILRDPLNEGCYPATVAGSRSRPPLRPNGGGGAIDALLKSKAADLAPQTLNHLRGYLRSAFEAARRAGKYGGTNPAAEVRKRRVPRRVPDYLKANEVPSVMEALDAAWRPLFATAIYTGMRKGELLELRKTDVHFDAGLITVARSYEAWSASSSGSSSSSAGRR